MLQDNNFRWFSRMSTEAGNQETVKQATPVYEPTTALHEMLMMLKFLAFPCGLLRGTLSNMQIESVVSAEISNLPQCKWFS